CTGGGGYGPEVPSGVLLRPARSWCSPWSGWPAEVPSPRGAARRRHRKARSRRTVAARRGNRVDKAAKSRDEVAKLVDKWLDLGADRPYRWFCPKGPRASSEPVGTCIDWSI